LTTPFHTGHHKTLIALELQDFLIRHTARISYHATSGYSPRWKESWKDPRLEIKLKCCLQWAPFSARFLVRSLSRCLMNGTPDFASASIEDGNISKLIYFHLSILFALEIFIARMELMHPCMFTVWLKVNCHVSVNWDGWINWINQKARLIQFQECIK
jgi:hypothetical protein